MPLYEYRCSKCDHLEEVLQKASDPAPEKCPECGAEHTMAKEVSLTSFQLKGGGWYKDLYSSTPKDGGGKSGGADKSSSDKGSEKKSEKKAKPEKKSSGSKAAGGSKAAA